MLRCDTVKDLVAGFLTDLFVTPSGTTFNRRRYSRWLMITINYILGVVGVSEGEVLNLETYILSADYQS